MCDGLGTTEVRFQTLESELERRRQTYLLLWGIIRRESSDESDGEPPNRKEMVSSYKEWHVINILKIWDEKNLKNMEWEDILD
jgi:hypothetical protein